MSLEGMPEFCGSKFDVPRNRFHSFCMSTRESFRRAIRRSDIPLLDDDGGSDEGDDVDGVAA